MSRERDAYRAVKNYAKGHKWAPDDFPMPDLPAGDPLSIPANK